MSHLETASFELAVYAKGDPESQKFAILLPGRLDTKDYAHMRSHVGFLASKGYFALSFDPPGTWGSSGNIDLYTTTNYLKATSEIIEHFGNRPTLAMGHSRGGTMAMLAGVNIPAVTHIVSVMSHYGPSSVNDEARQAGISISHRDLPPGTERTVEKRRFDLPLSYFDDSTEYTGLDTCAKPKLLFFGTKDDLVTPADVRATYDLAADPKRIESLDSEHDYRLRPEIIGKVNNVVGEFLEST